jgi:hypothetical protein
MLLRRARAIIPFLLLAASGCRERPKAPPLVNDTVYQNNKIGLRFLAPEGWSVVSRADLPATLPKPVILIAYQQNKGDSQGELEVLAADLAEGADLERFLIEHRIGAAAWAVKSPPEPVTINGAEAMRLVLARPNKGKGESRREATAFRRGGRIYFFIITFAAGDGLARDAARQSVQSATWAR